MVQLWLKWRLTTCLFVQQHDLTTAARPFQTEESENVEWKQSGDKKLRDVHESANEGEEDQDPLMGQVETMTGLEVDDSLRANHSKSHEQLRRIMAVAQMIRGKTLRIRGEGKDFEGTWIGKGIHQPGTVIKATVTGDMLMFPRGEEIRVNFPNRATMQFEYDGKMYMGKMEKGEVRWDDGDLWWKAGATASEERKAFEDLKEQQRLKA